MMVVMLIMSIIMAAFAPVVTTRNKSGDNSERWRWAQNRSDIYYGLGESQVAMIGQNNRQATDPSSKLLISTLADGQNHILFKRAINSSSGTILGKLYLDGNKNLILGNGTSGTAERSTSLGIDALTSNTTGNNNTAIGVESLKSNTTGYDNTSVGQGSMMNNTTGNGNVSIGNSSMRSSTTASNNVSIGQDSMYSNLSGSQNVSVGWEAMNKNKTGNNNTVVGYQAMQNNDSGYNNVAVGQNALLKNTTGYYNVAVGLSALSSVTDGVDNTAVGYEALAANTASYNTAVGERSLTSNTSGNYNSALGNSTLRSNTSGVANTGLGVDTLYNNTTGSYNIGIGYQAVYYNTTGSNNIGVGRESLRDNTIGKENIGIGYHALAQTKSDCNVAIGNYSSRDNISGSNNTSVGYDSLRDNTGSNNVAIGYRANMSDDGSTVNLYETTAVGSNAKATGYYSTTLGSNATATGNYNLALGYNACQYATGPHKVCIGANSGPKSGTFATDSEERIFIGSKSKFNNADAVLEVHNISASSNFPVKRTLGGSYKIPNNASGVVINGDLIVKGHLLISAMHGATSSDIKNHGSYPFFPAAKDDEMTMVWDYRGINNATISHPLWNTSYDSDRRLKYVGSENKSGLDKIRELKIFNFTFKKDKEKIPHVGVMAQDLQKVFPDAVSKGEDGFLSIRMEDMFYAAINAIKELASRMDKNEQKIKQLELENKELKARLERLEKSLK